MKLIIVVFLLLSGSAAAVVDTYQFENDSLRVRYYQFVEELRCPNCQSQNLAGSNSMVAADLRREVHRLLHEGLSDQQITEHMINRYGDYILYRPQFKSETALLWGAPIIFIVIGLVAVVLIGRKRTRALVSEGQLSAAEQQEFERLLRDSAEQVDKNNE
jgi:cytochrome c-type biogenesis protein CcmH